MSRLRWIWHELTRPRGVGATRRYHRVGRRSQAGVALLMVVASILLLTILVTEISRGAAVRMQLAQHHRDEVRAELLAASGVQIYRLVLMASKQLGNNPMIQQAGQLLGINGDSLWQMVPTINTHMMRMLFVTKGDLDDMPAELTEEQMAESRSESSAFKRNFLDFEGDFSAHIDDENRFVFVGGFAANDLEALEANVTTQQLYGLMNREEYNEYFIDMNLDKLELIANLIDWTDRDDLRLYEGGREDSLYERLDSPYRAKNAPFDTRQEIRLVDGWHLDGVWERVGKHLTVYGGGKVNVNTAHRPVIFALFQGFTDNVWPDQIILEWVDLFMQARNLPIVEGGIYFQNGQQFYQFCTETLQIPLRPEAANAVTGESTTFRVTSVGEVGEARVEIEAVLDYTIDPTGSVLYWNAR